MIRKLLPLAGMSFVCVVTLATAGCSSSSAGPSTPPSSTPASTSAPASTTAPPATPTPPTSATPTPAATTPPVEPAILCRLSELSVTAGQSSGGAGQIVVPVLFRNVSSRTCLLQGYPGVAGLNAAGQQAAQAVRTPFGQSGVPAPVTLAPGKVASAPVQGTDVPSGNATTCPQYASLLVTPPGETRSQRVQASLPGCGGLRVGPVVSGTTGI
jgi:hypothetical protein